MDNNNGMEGFEEQIANNMRYNLKDEYVPERRSFLDFISRRNTLILGGIGVLLLIVLIALFFGDGDELSKKDATFFKAKFDLLERRLSQIEEMELKVASLEKKQRELNQSMTEADKSQMLLIEQYTVLTQTLDRLQKGKTPVSVKIKKTVAPQKKSAALGKKRFHKVRSGDTLYRIANRYGISVKELCRFNNIGQNKIIQPGQKLIVSSGGQK